MALYKSTCLLLLLCVLHVNTSPSTQQRRHDDDLPTLPTWSSEKDSVPRDEEQVSRTLQNLLGLEDAVGREDGRPPMDMAAPRYMQQLYEQYSRGERWQSGRRTGNTVRSITAHLGKVAGRVMFLFNLSVIVGTEQVFGSDVHIYRRKVKVGRKNSPPKDISMHVYNAVDVDDGARELAVVPMHAKGHGWHSFDITKAVSTCLRGGYDVRRNNLLLALSFTDDDGVPLSHKKFMEKLRRPFLIVFSNDTQNITVDQIKPHFDAKAMTQQMVDPETGEDTKGIQGKSRKRGRQRKAMDDDNKEGRERRARSIHDNEIPDDLAVPEVPEPSYNVPDTKPGNLPSFNVFDLDPLQLEPEAETLPVEKSSRMTPSLSRLIPYPRGYKASKRRRRKNKQRKNDRLQRLLPLPKEWEKMAEQERSMVTSKEKASMCGLKKLVLDFADIGWSDWIISPKSFEANYCSGLCSFPRTTSQKMSNHATIQSLVHAVGLQGGVPEPCCVPDSMSSVTLLYFDENWNAVLKNYPAMTVQSCVCR